MSGTRTGGKKAAATIKAKYGNNFYAAIGAKGGRNGNTGGFAARKTCNCDIIHGVHHKAQCAGARGGMISRRGKKKKVVS